jgi:hypothetical protein
LKPGLKSSGFFFCENAPAFANSSESPRFSLIQFFAGGDLSGLQKSFDEFAFAADSHAGKFLEPFAVRHFGFDMKPVGQKSKLVGGNVATADPVKQVSQKWRRKIVAADAGHGYSP